MKKEFIKRKIIILIILLITSISYGAALVSDTWANTGNVWDLKKYIAVHPGTAQSVWENRAYTTNGLMEMTALGDGTYEAVLGLNAGATYNYLFFVKTGNNPPPGLQPNYTYYDCVPTGGNIACGTAPYVVLSFDTTTRGYAYYSQIQWFDGTNNNYDARRVVTIPSNLSPGDSLYIYNNFSDRPGIVTDFNVVALDTTTAYLSWSNPSTSWGSTGSMIAADVVAGGYYKIYRNTTGSTTAYTLRATVDGSVFSFTDTGLTQGQTYYYVIVAYDAYQGTGDSFAVLAGDTTAQDSVTMSAPVRVRFKVEKENENSEKYYIYGFNWDYVKQNNYEVSLTSEKEKDIFFARRARGKIAKITM
ncbi:MAG TPA: fibronectin type III domain-containing protein [bacterium]|nr:fibronectin type III domain-containing protein [bacterium]HOK41881.1 fibronectin type III domain-containing protein [bacterium]HOL47133.1 fibronectin type III domain-containing protein [bacterium]HPQ17922.1 fibronectin type III domain-containing protein [bacterium]